MILTKVHNDDFIIRDDTNKVYIRDDQYNTIKALAKLGYHKDEIYQGMQALIAENYDYANFGINKTFIFADKIGLYPRERN